MPVYISGTEGIVATPTLNAGNVIASDIITSNVNATKVVTNALSSNTVTTEELLPLYPKFSANGGPTLDTTTNAITVTFTSLTINIGEGFNTSTGRFTAPRAGNYFFSFGGMCGGAFSVRWQFYKNQNTPIGDQRFAAQQLYESFSGDCIVDLAVGETLEVKVTPINTERNILHASYRHFVGYLLP